MHNIPSEIYGAWVASKSQIIAANAKAINRHWGAKFEENKLIRIVDESAQQLVVPLLVNHPIDKAEKSYRCMVWLKIANKNERICALFDVDQADIESMIRPSEKGLHGMISMLLESINIVNIDEYAEPGSGVT